VRLAYKDTFTRRPVTILAPVETFLKEFGFKLTPELEKEKWVRQRQFTKHATAREDARPTAKTHGDVTR
jgi:hypothetical protein